MRKLENNESNLWERKKQGLSSRITFHLLDLTTGGQAGGNVKINVDRIAAKRGQNGGNFGATQSSSFVAGSCCNLATAPLFFALHTCSVRDLFGLSQFISLTLPDCQCNMSGKQQVIVGKKKLDQIFLFHQRRRKCGRVVCLIFSVNDLSRLIIIYIIWSILNDHEHYRIKARLKFLFYFWYFSDVTDGPFSFRWLQLDKTQLGEGKLVAMCESRDRRKKRRHSVGF